MSKLRDMFSPFKDLVHQPSSLRKAASEIPNFESIYNASKSFNLTWERILGKIKRKDDLDAKEIQRILLYFTLIDDQELYENLKYILENKKSTKDIETGLLVLNNDIREIEPIRFILKLNNLANIYSKILNEGIINNKDAIIDEGWQGLINNLLKKIPEDGVSSFKEQFKLKNKHNIWRDLLYSMIDLDTSGIYLLNYIYEISQEIGSEEQIEQSDMNKFDRWVGKFISSGQSWEGKVLNNDYPLVKLAYFFLEKLMITKEELSVNLRKVLEQRENLLNAIDLLNIEKARGDFWKEWIESTDRVIPKKDSSTTVAVAFFFGNTVIVEFAPTGNAAHLYNKDDFLNLNKKATKVIDWKNKEESKKTRIPRTRKDGTLHHTGNWKGQFTGVIRYLLRNK